MLGECRAALSTCARWREHAAARALAAEEALLRRAEELAGGMLSGGAPTDALPA
jgi:hypothetical protein